MTGTYAVGSIISIRNEPYLVAQVEQGNGAQILTLADTDAELQYTIRIHSNGNTGLLRRV